MNTLLLKAEDEVVDHCQNMFETKIIFIQLYTLLEMLNFSLMAFDSWRSFGTFKFRPNFSFCIRKINF